MASTIALSTASWDLTLNAQKHIAIATGAQSIAQQVACAIRVWLGELYYDTTQGINFIAIFTRTSNTSVLAASINAVALLVPGVLSAKTTLAPLNTTTRQVSSLSGVISIVTTTSARPIEVQF